MTHRPSRLRSPTHPRRGRRLAARGSVIARFPPAEQLSDVASLRGLEDRRPRRALRHRCLVADDNRHLRSMEAFINHVQGKPVMIADAEQGYIIQQLVATLYQSAETGTRVEL